MKASWPRLFPAPDSELIFPLRVSLSASRGKSQRTSRPLCPSASADLATAEAPSQLSCVRGTKPRRRRTIGILEGAAGI